MNATITSVESAPAQVAGGTAIRLLLEQRHQAAYAVMEMRAAPGFAGPPMPHHHTREEASFVVLEGALIVAIGGVDHRIEPGGLVHLPRGVDFTWRNASGDAAARFLCIYAPAGFEQMFVDTAHALAGQAPTPAVMREVMPPLWQKYGIGLPG